MSVSIPLTQNVGVQKNAEKDCLRFSASGMIQNPIASKWAIGVVVL